MSDHTPATPTPGPTPGPRRRRRPTAPVAVTVAVSLAASLLAVAIAPRLVPDPTSTATTPAGVVVAAAATDEAPAPAEAVPFTVVVDPTLPTPAPLAPLRPGDAERPAGRMVHDGEVIDVVTDELVVSAPAGTDLAPFLTAWGATIVEQGPADPADPVVDHLVRIDPTRGAATSPAELARLLGAVDRQEGELRLADDALVGLLTAFASAATDHGLDVTLNTVDEGGDADDADPLTGILTQNLRESDDAGNPFGWTYLASGTPQDFGVDAAWQLLAAHGRLDGSVQVPVLVHDGGFSSNWDFPEVASLHNASWGEDNPVGCSGGNPCPHHGTHVVLTLMGQLDNGYGVAGPAGPVASLVALQLDRDDWTRLNRLEDLVDATRPKVVNMSYGGPRTIDRAGVERRHERRYRRMVDDGALLVASAGNDGADVDTRTCVAGHCSENKLWLPCEIGHVVCVGGLASNSTNRAGGSNYGQADSGTSVELWGPMVTRTINDPNRTALDFTTRSISGTSFASPFVAGVAALVAAANPSLGPAELRSLLRETANVGVAGTWIGGSERRVNARAAVARALGVEIGPPQVVITGPADGHRTGPDNLLQLRGTAVAFTGLPLPLRWTSSLDGPLGGVALADGLALDRPLSLGTHTITAHATDLLGVEGTATTTIVVAAAPPKASIVFPGGNGGFFEGDEINLVGDSADGDTYQALPDDAVRWELRRAGETTPMLDAKGHLRTIPGHVLPAGTYEVRFVATSAGGETADTRAFTVAALPPGQGRPVATILAPEAGSRFGSSGAGAAVRLRASATDPEDGAISGTRMRWFATAAGTVRELCTGSAVPGAGGPGSGGLTVAKSCADVTVTLPVPPGAPANDTWMLVLQVFDSSGLPAKLASVPVSVHAAVG